MLPLTERTCTWAVASLSCAGSAAGSQRSKGGRIPGRARCRTAAPGRWPALPLAADRLPVASAAKGEGFRVVLDAERLHLGDGQLCRVRRIGCRWPARQRGKDSGSCSMPNGCTWAMASPAACGGPAAGGQRGKGGRIPGRARCRTAGPTIAAMGYCADSPIQLHST